MRCVSNDHVSGTFATDSEQGRNAQHKIHTSYYMRYSHDDLCRRNKLLLSELQ